MTVVGVGGRDTAEEMAGFVARHQLSLIDHAADVDGKAWLANGVVGQPAWVFIDGETGIATKTFGALGADGLTTAIEEHLTPAPS